MRPAMEYLIIAGVFVVIAVIAFVFILGARAASTVHPPDESKPEE
jgi:hypothetical protein